jgi:hypothetical protein
LKEEKDHIKKVFEEITPDYNSPDIHCTNEKIKTEVKTEIDKFLKE